MTNILPGVGVFGTGWPARAVIHLLQSAGFKIVALWGRTKQDAEDLAIVLNVPFYTCNIDDVLLSPDVDLVCIQCPPSLQSQIAVKTLSIGKHVLCDHHAGLKYSDTERMIDAARYYPSLMSLITYYLRFLPTFLEMKRHIESGYIGETQIIEMRVYCGLSLDIHYNWFHDRRMKGGMLSTFGGHFIDIASFVSGQKACKVHGFLTTFQKYTPKVSGFREITSDDFCTFQMKMDNGTCCICTLNNNLPGKFSYEVIAVGTKACLTAKDGYLYGQSKSASSSASEKELLAEDSHELPTGLKDMFPDEIVDQIPTPFCQGMFNFFESLKLSCLQQSDRRQWDSAMLQSSATFKDALYVQSVLDSILRSSQTCDWEQVYSSLNENYFDWHNTNNITITFFRWPSYTIFTWHVPK